MLTATMDKKRVLLFIALGAIYTAASCPAANYGYHPNTTTTEVQSNGNIIFRMPAPSASSVQLVLGINSGAKIFPSYSMTQGAGGIWSITIGPNIPRYYEYNFVVDGVSIFDPGNGLIKAHRAFSSNLIQVPGDPLSDTQNIPHGKLHTETYYSSVLGAVRNFIVYTPPGYAPNSSTVYPILFLYQGDNDKPYTLVDDGRVTAQFDFMIADGQAIPMIVALVNLHALAPENFQASNGDFLGYFPINWSYADQELMVDIVPFLKSRYHMRTDAPGMAIAGFSAGGFNALESGVIHLGVFGSIGALAALPAYGELGNTFYSTLSNATVVNQELKLFYIGMGDEDAEAGFGMIALDGWLTNQGVQHRFDVVNGVHNTYTISRELHDYVARLFRW